MYYSSLAQGVSFRCTSTTGASDAHGHMMAGLGKATADDKQHYTSLVFGIQCHHNGDIGIYESGAHKGYFGSYTATDVLKVQVTGSSVQYLKNGESFYSSKKMATFPLRVDTALYSQGAEVSDVTMFLRYNACKYFLFGTGGSETGKCWTENVATDDCNGHGFKANVYNTYKLTGTKVVPAAAAAAYKGCT